MAQILSDFTSQQVKEARDLIAYRLVVRLAHPGAYRVASSDRTTSYLTTANGCNCPQYLRRLMPRPCKHNLAVRLIKSGSYHHGRNHIPTPQRRSYARAA